MDARAVWREDDGVRSIWWRGWELRFPEDGGRPAVTRGDPPAGARPAGRAVKTRTEGDSAFLHYEAWAVAFPPGDGKPLVTPIKAPVSAKSVARLLRRLRKR